MTTPSSANDGMTSRADELDVLERSLARHTRLARWALASGILVALLVAAGVGWLLLLDDYCRWADRRPLVEAESEIDGQRLHSILIPRWQLALDEGRRDQARSTADEIRAAIDGRPELLEIFGQLEAVSATGALESLERRHQLWTMWNRALADHDAPWIAVMPTSDALASTSLITLNYRVLHRFVLRAGDLQITVPAAVRVDPLNVIETVEGRTDLTTLEAYVFTNASTFAVVDHTWPLLGDGEGLDAVAAAWAPSVKAELRSLMSGASYRRFSSTANARAALNVALDGIRSRQHCSTISLSADLGIRGLELETLAFLRGSVGDGPCADVWMEEYRSLASNSERLARAVGLRQAVAELVALLALDVALHEARHVHDTARGMCATCPVDAAPEWNEYSAYLSTLVATRMPAVQMYSLCRTVGSPSHAHARAARRIVNELLDGDCTAEPPADLVERARTRHEMSFPGRPALEVVSALPERLDFQRTWNDLDL